MKKCEYCGTTMSDDIGSCPKCGAPQKIQTSAPLPDAKPDPSKPLFEFRSGGIFFIRLYPNRIAIEDKRGGVRELVSPKRTDIPIKNITGVNIKGYAKRLELTLSDGTCRELPVIYGKHSEQLRAAVLVLL